MFECEKCGKEFKFKYLIEKHNNRKTTCYTPNNIKNTMSDRIQIFENKIYEIENEITNKTNKSLDKLKCMFCDKNMIPSKSNIKRHLKSHCSIKTQLINEVDDLKIKLQEAIEKYNKFMNDFTIKTLKNKIDKIESTTKHMTQNITQNITINNNTQIHINPFGKEDLSHITDADYNKFFNGFFLGFVNYIKKVHFDVNAPQNHNICITNLKSNFLSVYDGVSWNTKTKSDIIDSFINKKHNTLTDKCEELREMNMIDDQTLYNYEEFCRNFKDPEARKITKTQVITMIYDNKKNNTKK